MPALPGAARGQFMIIMLTGANDFAIRQALDKLVGAYLSKFGVHAIERVDGESFEPTSLSELLQGASLFASQRLVVVRDASKNKPLWEAIGDWIERVPTEVMLVLVESSPDKRTRTYKQLQKHADVRDFPGLSEPELARWLVVAAKEAGASIDHKTAAHLVRQVGTDQWRLHTELQKLVAYLDLPKTSPPPDAANTRPESVLSERDEPVGSSNEEKQIVGGSGKSGAVGILGKSGCNPAVAIDVIDELVEPSPQTTAFELLDSVLQGDAARASDLLNRLKASEDPYRLFGLLVSQVQTLALVVTAGGKPAGEVAKEAGIHSFVVRKMQPLTRSITYARLQEIIAAVAQVDASLKSSGIDPWVLLGQCLGKIASKV
jgi:DNA polymerase III delta subunit